MAIDDVEDISPMVQYVASASQTVFDYVFPIFENADLVVYDNSTLMALNTDYTVTGAGNDTGGSITFLVGRTTNHVITIYRNIPIERISQFANDGPMSSDTFNEELNRVTMVEQQLNDRILHCLRLSELTTVPTATLELDMALFAGKYLTFDVNGIPTPASATVQVVSGSIPGLSQDGGLSLIYAPVSGTVFSVDVNGMITCGGIDVTATGIPNAGMYRPGTNILGFSTNGTARATISATGLVNIPTPDSSGVALTINGHTVAAVAFVKTVLGNVWTATDGTRTAALLTVSGGYQLLATSAHSLALGANNAVHLTMSSTGENVFVGGVATTPVDLGNSGTAIAVNCRLSNVFVVTMTGSVSSGNFTLTNPSDGQTINMKITQDGTGSRTLGFSSSILFPGGVDGVLSTVGGSVDYLVMTYHADTSKWHAVLTQAFA